MENNKVHQHNPKNLKILINPPQEDLQEKKGIEIFKFLHIPNLEKILEPTQNLYSDFLNFAGELWNKSTEKEPVVHRKSNSSASQESEEPPSNIIILRKKSSIGGSIVIPPSKPKKIRNSKSFAPIASKKPFLQIEDDVQPQVASINNQSLIEQVKAANNESQIGHLSSIVNMNSIDYNAKNSVIYKDVSIMPGLFDSIVEREVDYSEYSKEKSEASEHCQSEVRRLSEKPSYKEISEICEKKHVKAHSQTFYKGIPDIFDVRTQSILEQKTNKSKKNKFVLETEPDMPDNEKSNVVLGKENNSQHLLKNSMDESYDELFTLIPKSILYQIPILTFEEFINSLLNDEIKIQKGIIWTVNLVRRFFNRCFCRSLSDEDHKICEKIIFFSLTKYNFQNSLHIILLLSTYKSVTKSDRWPHKFEDWYEMGFSTGNIELELMQNGTITLLNIFFLASYFPTFYSEMLRVRRYYPFDLYNIISSISQISMKILQKNKLSKLIKANGRALEVIFFFFAGIMLYWFKKYTKSKDFLKIYDSTVRKASNSMNELLKEAWRVYLDNQGS